MVSNGKERTMVEDRIAALEARAEHLEARLRRLESRPIEAPSAAWARRPKAIAAPAAVSAGDAAPGAPPAVTSPRAPAPPPLDPGRPAVGLEDFVGGRLLAWLGGVAVVVGLAFLLTVAVSRGWLGEGARTLLAGALSAALLAVGARLRERRGRNDAALAAAAAPAALALVVAVVVWALFIAGDDSDKNKNTASAPIGASVAQLRSLQRELGHPIYWVGEKKGYTYELTHTNDGNVYVRYLPPGVALNDRRPLFLTIGTYPYSRAVTNLRRYRSERGAFVKSLPGGALAVSPPSRRQSVYVAHRGENLVIEVFDPSAARARRLALSGRVVPVG
jgi:hypothetical protein